jgi:hypothetical protein
VKYQATLLVLLVDFDDALVRDGSEPSSVWTLSLAIILHILIVHLATWWLLFVMVGGAEGQWGFVVF